MFFGSLIGTTIEFFDFYIYANAAVLVFPQLFSFGGQYQFGFTLLGHVFDSISFSAWFSSIWPLW
jgi:hypothetical protein